MSKKDLQKAAEQATKEVDRLRKDFKADKNNKTLGRKLFNARKAASAALDALYAEHPELRPAEQKVQA